MVNKKNLVWLPILLEEITILKIHKLNNLKTITNPKIDIKRIIIIDKKVYVITIKMILMDTTKIIIRIMGGKNKIKHNWMR